MKTLKSVKFWLVILVVVTVVATANTTLLMSRLLSRTDVRDDTSLEEFKEKLNLSSSQYQKAVVVMAEERQNLKRIERKIQAEMKPHVMEVIQTTNKKLEALLTPEQKKKWELLKKEQIKGYGQIP